MADRGAVRHRNYPHLASDAQGAPVLAGTTMKVVELVMAQRAQGWSPEEMHFQYPSLPLRQIQAVLAYYRDHKDELDAEIERRSRYAEQARQDASPCLTLFPGVAVVTD
ncbi:MAG TPA: DUF433 domain-containing protein [Thermoanaerobaculia bacterium]|nr:DUF433 domain-containing protein [Thermoanaerobaculia bacterium]